MTEDQPQENVKFYRGETFKERLFIWVKRPSVFHGFLTGILLFVSKFIFYISENWGYVFEPAWMFFSFLIMVISMIMANRAEKQLISPYPYKEALFTCSRIIIIAVALSVFADVILYHLIDGSLAVQTQKIQIQKTLMAFNELPVAMSDVDKDMMIEELRKTDPSAPASLFSNWISKAIANLLLALLLALFFRKKQPKNEWLNQ